jgi:hypothetical protein
MYRRDFLKLSGIGALMTLNPSIAFGSRSSKIYYDIAQLQESRMILPDYLSAKSINLTDLIENACSTCPLHNRLPNLQSANIEESLEGPMKFFTKDLFFNKEYSDSQQLREALLNMPDAEFKEAKEVVLPYLDVDGISKVDIARSIIATPRQVIQYNLGLRDGLILHDRYDSPELDWPESSKWNEQTSFKRFLEVQRGDARDVSFQNAALLQNNGFPPYVMVLANNDMGYLIHISRLPTGGLEDGNDMMGELPYCDFQLPHFVYVYKIDTPAGYRMGSIGLDAFDSEEPIHETVDSLARSLQAKINDKFGFSVNHLGISRYGIISLTETFPGFIDQKEPICIDPKYSNEIYPQLKQILKHHTIKV